MENQLLIVDERIVLGKNFRIFGNFEEPLFLAKDIAEWIEHSNVTEMVRGIDDSEKLTSTILSAGQNREMTFVTEDGLYELLMLSKKPIAKEFKAEVKKILKSVRKHGAYMTPETLEHALNNPDFIIQLATRLKEEQAKVKALEPKAEFFDQVADSKDAISIRDCAKVLNIKGVGQNNLFRLLRKYNILMENNIPYQEYCDRGYFRVIEQKFTKDGEPCINFKTLVYQKGLDYIRRKLKDRGYA